MGRLRAVPATTPGLMDPDIPLPSDSSWPGAGWDLDAVADLREHLLWMRMQGRSDRTLGCRRRVMVGLAEYLGRDPVDATYRELYGWQVNVARTSIGYMSWQTSLIRPYYRWLHDRGVRPDNPAALLPCPPAKPGLPRPMDEHKVMQMIADAPPRLLPWLILAAWCGLRAGEIAAMRVEHLSVDRAGRAWCLVHGKGGRQREVSIPSWAWPIVQAASAPAGPCWRKVIGFGAVGPDLVSGLCNTYLHKIGIADTLHSLRHRAATLMLDDTQRIEVVQDFLGHSNPRITRVYTLVRSSRIGDAIDRLPRPSVLPAGTPGAPAEARHLHVVDDTAHGGSA